MKPDKLNCIIETLEDTCDVVRKVVQMLRIVTTSIVIFFNDNKQIAGLYLIPEQ